MSLPRMYNCNGAITTEGQNAVANWLNRELLACQTMIVEGLLSHGIDRLDWSDVENLYVTNDTGDEEPQEIYEWWLVSGWLCEQLASQGEPVLRRYGNNWWGRCCTGQWVGMDDSIIRLAAKYNVVDCRRYSDS